MITELHIENIAVIKKLTVDFKSGFSVLTGETGAGKSIIIDSVGLLLGARSARELIRNGESFALVSATFSDISEGALKELEALDVFPEDDGNIYVQRTLNADGRSQAKINGRSVPGSVLREAGKYLINIHGQHDNQQLLAQEKHISFLDSWAHNEDIVSEYNGYYAEMVRLRREIRSCTKNEQEAHLLTESLTAKINEIEQAKLKAGEEEALTAKLERIKNIEKISRYCREIGTSLTDSTENGSLCAIELIEKAIDAASRLRDALPDSQAIIERLRFCCVELKDVSESALSLIDGDMSDPEAELDRIEARLDLISRLERKYGDTVEEVLHYKEQAAKQLSDIKNSDALVKELKSELSGAVKRASACSERLTAKRKEYAEHLSKEITEQLRYLDLEKAVFEVSVTPLESENGVKRFSAQGCDMVEFLISTNPGEPLKPLSKVASGGELSRVMLALKSVLADSDGVGTIIFDEIDTGVSGKTSQKIGIKLLALAERTQVFCITHSAQIAAMGDTHYKISKREIEGRNETDISDLDFDARVDELSRIMGGIQITETIKNTAKEMIKESDNYRTRS